MRANVAATATVLAMLHATISAVEPPSIASLPVIAAVSTAAPIEASTMPVPPFIRLANPLEAEQVPAAEGTMTPLFVPTEAAVTEPTPTEPTVSPVPPTAPAPVVDPPPIVATPPGADANGIPTTQHVSSAVGGPTTLLLKDNTAVATASTADTAPASATWNKNKTATPLPTPSSSLRWNASDDDRASGSDYLDTSLSYACVCKDVRKVSLMSASDYCLSPAAVIGNKCGNAAVGEKGECPLAGAQPCQDTGHVLANDSMCAFDKRDETYKCVASKEDLYIQKNGKKKKKSLNSTSSPPRGGGASGASAPAASHSALRLVLLVASLAVGLAAVA